MEASQILISSLKSFATLAGRDATCVIEEFNEREAGNLHHDDVHLLRVRNHTSDDSRNGRLVPA